MKDRSRTIAEWVGLIDEWQESGLKQPEFCQLKGIKVGTLQSRLYKTPFKQAIEAYRRELLGIQSSQAQIEQPRELVLSAGPLTSNPINSKPSPTFVPVRFKEPTAQRGDHSTIEIILDSGRRIAVKPGFDQDTLRKVVATLES